MGKLADLWASLKTCPPDRKPEIQKKINSIEKWMIDNKIGTIKEITDWNKKKSTKKTYRYEAEKMHGYNAPPSAKFGKDRCKMCVYNKHPWCDRGITKECFGFV